MYAGFICFAVSVIAMYNHAHDMLLSCHQERKRNREQIYLEIRENRETERGGGTAQRSSTKKN